MDFGSSSSRFSQILTSPSLPQVTMQLFKDKDLLTFRYRKDSHSDFQSQNENVTEVFVFYLKHNTYYVIHWMPWLINIEKKCRTITEYQSLVRPSPHWTHPYIFQVNLDDFFFFSKDLISTDFTLGWAFNCFFSLENLPYR